MDLFRDFLRTKNYSKIAFPSYPSIADRELPTNTDFRHVAMTRNWFDSIVSAYLYHKSGHECWLSERGDENLKHVLWRHWYVRLPFHERNGIPYPNHKNRSLCTYLSEESEQDGIRAIIDFALFRWYNGVVSYWKKAQARFHKDGIERVLFVCYEDLTDPYQQEEMFQRILQWLYPDQDMNNVSMPVDVQELLHEQKTHHSIYSGGHASDHDPLLRERLRTLVKNTDREYFNSTLALSNEIFECGGVEQRDCHNV